MEKPATMVTLICLCIILAVFIVFMVVKAIKNKWIGKLYETLKISIKEAEEKYPSGHGEEKKQYVLNALEEKAEELRIPWRMIFKAISNLINTIISNYNMLAK